MYRRNANVLNKRSICTNLSNTTKEPHVLKPILLPTLSADECDMGYSACTHSPNTY